MSDLNELKVVNEQLPAQLPAGGMKVSPPVTVAELLRGPRQVRRVRTRSFMLSVVQTTGKVIGVATYEIGSARPAPGEHLMLSAEMRDEWFARLRFA